MKKEIKILALIAIGVAAGRVTNEAKHLQSLKLVSEKIEPI